MAESLEELVLVAAPIAERPQPPIDVEAPGQEMPAPSLEQARAAEAVFAHKRTESETAGGILGMWMGGMLLKDVLQDTFSAPADEDDEDEQKKKKLPPPE